MGILGLSCKERCEGMLPYLGVGVVGVITNDEDLGGLLKELTRESCPSHFHWLPRQCDPIPKLGQSPD